MEIGIPRSTGNFEKRVSLLPSHVSVLVQLGHSVYVEDDAGLASGYPNTEYKKAGAIIKTSVSEYNLIVSVKPPPPEALRANQTIMAYLHIQKGQNPELLDLLLRKRIAAYAYEEIRDARSARLVNLGFEAGVIGTYEALRFLGREVAKRGKYSEFTALTPACTIGSIEGICRSLSSLCLERKYFIEVMGNGCVSRGVTHALFYTDISILSLYRDDTANIRDYLPHLDILVNAVDWYPWETHIVKRRDLHLMKRSAIIADISCDMRGAIETCVPRSWAEPIYKCDGITHFAVNNLPSAIPGQASAKLGSMILPYVIKVAAGDSLPSGLMTSGGALVYVYQHPEHTLPSNASRLAVA